MLSKRDFQKNLSTIKARDAGADHRLLLMTPLCIDHLMDCKGIISTICIEFSVESIPIQYAARSRS